MENQYLYSILWHIISFAGGILLAIVASWAKKGASTCCYHQDFVQSLTKLSVEIQQLIEINKDMIKKIENLSLVSSKQSTDIAVLYSKIECHN